MFDWKKIASIFVKQCSFTEINTPLIVDLNTTREMSNYLLKQILFVTYQYWHCLTPAIKTRKNYEIEKIITVASAF